MSTISIKRLSKSLLKLGLKVSHANGIFRLSRYNSNELIAEVLLPADMPLEKKAVEQLCAFASTTHPDGGKVHKTFATPDFHSGSLVPVGAVVATTPDMLIPQAIGTDIHCGMRLHIFDVDYEKFSAKKDKLISLLRGDLLLGTRNLPMQVRAFKALFNEGLSSWLENCSNDPLGQMKDACFGQIKSDVSRVLQRNDEQGSFNWAPDYLINDKREIIRDSYLGTLGGGNHFLEIQRIDEIFEKRTAFEWGVKKGQLAFMIHTGSRSVGIHVGNTWIDKAKSAWPCNLKRPQNAIYPLYGDLASEYLQALHTASNYAKLNRLVIAELVRLRIREVFAKDIEVPLIQDAPHNIIFKEGGAFLHRKGATPAHLNAPVLIPGSMGSPSYLMRGLGNSAFLNSASHGAGRAMSRFDVHQKHKLGVDVGLGCVECITLKEERKIEEAPYAYKDINEVIKVQQDHGIVAPVARFQPILTFKG